MQLRAAPYHCGRLPLPERQLVSRVRKLTELKPLRAAGRKTVILTGIGDDCSVLRVPAGHDVLVTTDFSLEGVHFRRAWHSPESIGHRCLARGLSDIAAMGGDPVAAFLSLALPADVPQKWADRFFRGLLRLAKTCGVQLAGGDTARSPSGVLADIVILGSIPRGTAVLRSGARAGDCIYVTGQLGGSAATLELLRSHARKVNQKFFPQHFNPQPRINVARILREKSIPTAMIDISDGLSTDLHHICAESGLGAVIEENAIPRARIAKPARKVDLEFALHGGEDYELLFTAKPGTRVPATIAGVQVTRIGQMTRRGVYLLAQSGARQKLQPRGWEHFQQPFPDK